MSQKSRVLCLIVFLSVVFFRCSGVGEVPTELRPRPLRRPIGRHRALPLPARIHRTALRPKSVAYSFFLFFLFFFGVICDFKPKNPRRQTSTTAPTGPAATAPPASTASIPSPASAAKDGAALSVKSVRSLKKNKRKRKSSRDWGTLVDADAI